MIDCLLIECIEQLNTVKNYLQKYKEKNRKAKGNRLKDKITAFAERGDYKAMTAEIVDVYKNAVTDAAADVR